MKAFKQHDLGAIFPAMGKEEYSALCDDIEKQKLREPIWLYENKVLDGWHRYCACRDRKIEVKFKTFRGDPVAFVTSKNLRRRDLNAGQRAMIMLKLSVWAETGRPAKDAETASTVDEIAAAAGVSRRVVQQAKKVQINGSKALQSAVASGKISVEKGAAAAPFPKSQQVALSKLVPGNQLSEYANEPKEVNPETVPWKKFKAVSDELDELRDTVDVLTAQAETAQALLSTDAAKEMVKLRGDLRLCTRRRDELLNENATLKGQCKYWRSKFEKLEKANAGKSGK